MKHLSLSLLALALAAGTATAGTVEVTLVKPEQFTDAGSSRRDEQANAQALSRHLVALGQRLLPPQATLKVEVLDIDLAGSLQPWRGQAQGIRTVKGRADIPRIQLRYTLEVPGHAARSGEELLRDLDYSHGFRGARGNEPLYYEKRLLESWMKERFVGS